MLLLPDDSRPARTSTELRHHLSALRTRATAASDACDREGAPAVRDLIQVAGEIVAALGPLRFQPAGYDAGVDAAMDTAFLCDQATRLVRALPTPELQAAQDIRCYWSCIPLMLALHARAWDTAATLAADVYDRYGQAEEERSRRTPTYLAIYPMIIRSVRDQDYPTWCEVADLITTGRAPQTLMMGETVALIWLIQATHQHAHPDEPIPTPRQERCTP
jgi:hypothetical protein